MATDFRVVTPDDMGASIRLGVKEPNKYDVDLSQLDLPASVTGLTLQGTVLFVATSVLNQWSYLRQMSAQTKLCLVVLQG